MLAYLRFETVRSVRDVSFLGFLVGLPVLLYVIYGRDEAVMQGAQFRAFFLVSMASFAVMGAAMSASGTGLAVERTSGWIRQLRITPLSGRAWLATKILHGLLLVTHGLLAVALAGTLYGRVRLSPQEWAALAVALVGGAAPFVLLGLVVGLAFSIRAAQAAHTVLFLVLAFMSGIFVPWPQLPDLMQAVGVVLPLYHLADLGWEIVGRDPLEWVHPVVLAAWTVALSGGILVLRRRAL
jgi:ABC-2 type transport system permease protein